MSIINQAKIELSAINFGKEDSDVMIDILRKFLDQWDSGGAVAAAAPVFVKLLNGQPLSPLTGEESEWFIHDVADHCYAQNIRCSTVFKHRNGKCFDIDAPEPNSEITFPYNPYARLPKMPIFEIETG